MMKKLVLNLILINLVFTAAIFSQENKRAVSKKYSDAVALAEVEDYHDAILLLKEVLDEDPSSPEALYYTGYCYLNTPSGADSAISYFIRGLEVLPKEDMNSSLGIDLRYSLAKSHLLLMKFDSAIEEYETLLELVPADAQELQDRIKREIETCNNAIELVKKPVKLEVKNLGPNINSASDDHSPLISADGETLYFTTRRESEYSELMPDGQYSEKIYYSKDTAGGWSKAQILSKLFRKDGHESGVALSADGQELYLFRNDIEGRNLYVCYYDGSSWSEPVKLPKPINSIYDETHLTLNPDKTVMYFTSDRPGGYGGLDIYRVRRLPNGEWAVPQNLGPEINTPYDEETPFLHPDGRTLYFASEGHNSMGSFDIFVSRQQPDSTWSAPVNMGYPINTPDDDFFFVPTVSYNKAYYASAKFGDSYGGMDIYLVEYEEPEENRLAVLKGKVESEDDVPIENVRVYVTEKGDDALIGQYKPHAGTGNYVMILEAEKTYELKYSGEGFEDYNKEMTVTRSMTYSNMQSAKSIDEVTMIPVAKPVVVTEPVTTVAMDESDGIPYYTVQILTRKGPVYSWEKAFEGLELSLIKEYKCKNNMYRYAYGTYKGYKASLKGKEEVLNATSFDDSFIRDVKQYDELVETQPDDKEQ